MTTAMATQPTLEPALVHAISAADPDRRRRLSRTAGLAMAASVAAHVAVGLYIYEAKYAPTAVIDTTDTPISATVTPEIVVKTQPVKRAPPLPPRPLAVPGVQMVELSCWAPHT